MDCFSYTPEPTFMLNPELSVVPDPPEGQEMSAMRRVLLWGAGILAVLVLIACSIVLWYIESAQRQVTGQETFDRYSAAPGEFHTVAGMDFHPVSGGESPM